MARDDGLKRSGRYLSAAFYHTQIIIMPSRTTKWSAWRNWCGFCSRILYMRLSFLRGKAWKRYNEHGEEVVMLPFITSTVSWAACTIDECVKKI